MAQSGRSDRRRPPCQNTCVVSGSVLPIPYALAAGFKFQFRKEVIKQSLCDMMLKWNEVAMLKEAIKQDYFFELFFDDLPVWG